MQIKTYIDVDLASALAQASQELGADALVLGSREVRDDRGRGRTEITVGVQRPESRERAPRRESDVEARTAIRRLARSVAGRARAKNTERTAAVLEEPAPPAASAPTGAVDVAVRSLVQSGLSQDLATRFARIAGRHLKDGKTGRMALAAERAVSALLPFSQLPTRARVLFVVGPPGAGKTCAVAKLAALAVEESSRPVVYAMADTERIGALAESRIYAKHVGASLQVIDTPMDLRRTLREAGRRSRVLIDTAGVGASDDQRMSALGELRREAGDAQVALVVPAGLHRDEAARIFRQFASVRPTCVAFSKVDDGRRIGDLVTALAATDLPLSFMTNGHRVPDDLVAATPRRLAALMLRAGRPTDRPAAPTAASIPGVH